LSIASLFIENGAKEVSCTNPFELPQVRIDDPKIRFLQQQTEDIDWPEGYFDIIFGFSVLEHINETYKFLAE